MSSNQFSETTALQLPEVNSLDLSNTTESGRKTFTPPYVRDVTCQEIKMSSNLISENAALQHSDVEKPDFIVNLESGRVTLNPESLVEEVEELHLFITAGKAMKININGSTILLPLTYYHDKRLDLIQKAHDSIEEESSSSEEEAQSEQEDDDDGEVDPNSSEEDIWGEDEDEGVPLFYSPPEEIELPKLETRKLRMSAKPFIPKFHSSMNMKDVVAAIGDTRDEKTLLDLGYPSYILRKLFATDVKGTTMVRYPKREHAQHIQVEDSRSKVTGKSHSRYELGEVAQYWKVPLKPNAQVITRPRFYNRGTFRNWVYGQANLLSAQISHRYQIVSGNDSCRALFFSGGSIAQRTANNLLTTASVFILNFNAQDKTPIPMLMTEHLPKVLQGVLRIGAVEITTLDQLLTYELSFKRHKPIFKTAVAFITEDSLVNLPKLQASIDKLFPIQNPQGRCNPCNPCRFTVDLEDMKETAETISSMMKESTANMAKGMKDFKPLQLGIADLLTDSQQNLSRFGLNVSSFLVSLFNCNSWTATLSTITLFVSGNEMAWSYCKSLINGIIQSVTFNQTVGDSIFSVISENLTSLWDAVIGCTIATFLSETSGSLLGLVGPVLKDLVLETRRAIVKDKATEMAKSVITWIKDVITRIGTCVTEGSLHPLWGMKWDYREWERQAEGYKNYFVLLSIGTVVNPRAEGLIAELRNQNVLTSEWVTPVTIDEYIRRVNLHLDQGMRIKDYLNAYPSIGEKILRAHAILRNFIDGLQVQALGCNHRMAPFTIYWYGNAGVGKTNLARVVISALGNVHHIPHDAKAVYDWQIGTNFQDGLNHTQSWIVMDDVDTTVAPASAGVKTHVEAFQALVNNTPFPVEQAQVDRKGTVFGNPLGLMYCSNYIGMRANEFSLCPSAVYRRIKLHAEVKVKPEFSYNNGLLDPAKASAANTYDMFEITVRRYQGGLSEGRFLDDGVIMSFPSFLRVIHTEFAAHLAAEKKLLNRRANLGPNCISCGLSLAKDCGCSSVEYTVEPQMVRETYFEQVDQERNAETYRRASQEHTTSSPTGFVFNDPKSNRLRGEAIMLDRNVRLAFFMVTYNPYFSEWEQACHYAAELHDEVEANYPTICRIVAQFYRRNIAEREKHIGAFVKAEAHLKLWDCRPENGFKQPGRIMRYSTRFKNVSSDLQGVNVESKFNDDVKTALMSVAVGVSAGLLLYKLMETTVTSQLQGREANNCGLVPFTWFKADQLAAPGVAMVSHGVTYTKDDLIKTINDSIVGLSVKEHPLANGEFACVGFCVGQNALITVTHLAKIGETILISQHGTVIPCQVTEFNWRPLPSNPHISMLRCSDIRGTLTITKRMWRVPDESVQVFDEVEIYGPGLKYKPMSNRLRKDGQCKVLVTSAKTINGDCGFLYVVRHNTGWRIAGMHYQLAEVASNFGVETWSMAAVLSAQELETVAKTMGTELQATRPIISSMTVDPTNLVIGKFGGKSEILSAVIQNGVRVHPFGEMSPSLPGSTMKTKIVDSIYHEDFKAFEEMACGRRDYWRKPNFRGLMSEGVWRSPFTVMFDSQNIKVADEQLMRLALFDFLQGIDELDFSGYATLSEEGAFSGVPGSYVHSINMKTSVGPPFNKGKRAFMGLLPEGAVMAPEIAAMIDEIEQTLLDGEIPQALAVCSLKDEPLKVTKEFPRVFNNLPAATNIVLKKYLAPVKSFFRANFEFFESAVGINMTSSEGYKVVQRLKQIDYKLKKLKDGDIKAMDKSWSGTLYDFAAMVFYAASFCIKIDRPDYAYHLILGLKQTIYYVKGDLFNVPHNPSGNDVTVELNGVGLSLGERFVYYCEHPFKGDFTIVNNWFENFFTNPIPPKCEEADFRSNVALVSYGDDNVKAARHDFSDEYADHWLRLGMVMTDAETKQKKLSDKSLYEISWLQRKFKDFEDLEIPVAALSLKSMSRMVLFKKDSILSGPDHGAVALSEFMREAVYHGREFYNEQESFVRSVADKYQLTQNPYFDVRSFDERKEEVLNGSFCTWSLRNPVELEPLDLISFSLQTKMSNVHLVKEPNFVSTASFSEEVSQTHDTGVIESTSSSAAASMTVQPKFLQSMPQNPLSDFLNRATFIANFPLSGTDSPGVINTIDPWTLWLSNPAVAAKLETYSFLRAKMRLTFVSTMPGMGYGAYVLTALPDGTAGTNTISDSLRFYNCLQTDVNAVVDVAGANQVVFDLPWIFPIDYGRLRTPSDFASMWQVSLSCLYPVSTAVAGGIVTGNIRVYASLVDYELTIPHFQAKKGHDHDDHEDMPKLVHRTKASAVAGAVASVAEAASQIPIIGSYAQTAGFVARTAESVLSYFGFTRESQEATPIPIVNHSVTNVAHCDGGDASQTASLSFMNEISIDPTLAGFGEKDCLSNADLFSRWTLIKSFPWFCSSGASTIIGEIAVTPSFVTEGAGHFVQFMPAGFVGMPFSFWRGDMEYKFIIPVSKIHRGVIRVAWVPNESGIPPLLDITNLSLNAIYDVTAQSTHNFTVGFARENPFLLNRIYSDDLPIKPIGSTNGSLFIQVVNPLQAQTATANTMIYVFARAKQNMEFAVPRDHLLFTTVDDEMYNFKIMETQLQCKIDSLDEEFEIVNRFFQARSGALGDDDTNEEESITIVESSGAFPGDKLYFGEKFCSVRELLQKPSQIPTISLVSGSIVLPAQFVNPGAIGTWLFRPVWTWSGYLRSMFVGLAGSERIKVFPKQEMWIGASRYIQETSVAEVDFTPTMSPMTFCGPNKGAEFNIPYYWNRKYLLGRESADSTTPGPKTLISCQGQTLDTPIEVILYHSFGPDIRATCFRQVPVVSFGGVLPSPSWWAT